MSSIWSLSAARAETDGSTRRSSVDGPPPAARSSSAAKDNPLPTAPAAPRPSVKAAAPIAVPAATGPIHASPDDAQRFISSQLASGRKVRLGYHAGNHRHDVNGKFSESVAVVGPSAAAYHPRPSCLFTVLLCRGDFICF